MDRYIPPYDITEEMLDLTSEIMEMLGGLNNINDLDKLPRLRKVSRIKSIHSSLAIENNTLSMGQVTAVIEGKRVLASENDILAVTNAFECYKTLGNLNPFSISDLLKTHGIMMRGLVGQAGMFRTTSVGVINEKGKVLHIAPPSEMVGEQMSVLFDWLKNSKTHMLIKSAIFHYEFEFIHPFQDGNGRMGRLWQTVLLSSWKPVFQWIPIESIIKDNQEDYYKSIAESTTEGKSNRFIIFMLNIIKQAIVDLAKDARNHFNHISHQLTALMNVIESYPMTAQELMGKLGLKSRVAFRNNYLVPALELGLIEMTEPNKPTSRNQRYFKR